MPRVALACRGLLTVDTARQQAVSDASDVHIERSSVSLRSSARTLLFSPTTADPGPGAQLQPLLETAQPTPYSLAFSTRNHRRYLLDRRDTSIAVLYESITNLGRHEPFAEVKQRSRPVELLLGQELPLRQCSLESLELRNEELFNAIFLER